MRVDPTHQSGFTLLETIVAMTVVSLVSVTSVYILFLSLNLRDMTLTTTKTQEAIRVFERSFREAALGAISVTEGTNSLFLRSAERCWSFVYDPLAKNVKYTRTIQVGCVPDSNPVNLFFPSSIKISAMAFSVRSISTGGKLVEMTGTVQTVMPFDTYQTDISEAFVNLMD